MTTADRLSDDPMIPGPRVAATSHRASPGRSIGRERPRENTATVLRFPVTEVHARENDLSVMADDLLLDSLARLPRGSDLGGLLAGWQREMSVAPIQPPCVDVAARKLSRAQAHPARAAIGVAAAVITVLAGGAIVGSRLATPGDPLWPVATVLWSDRVHSADASHEVRQALNDASTALNAGNAPSAVSALTRASGNLPMVQPVDGRDGLQNDYDVLAVEVSSSMSQLAQSSATATEEGTGGHTAQGGAVPSAPTTDAPAGGDGSAAVTTPAARTTGSSRSAATSTSAGPTTGRPGSGSTATQAAPSTTGNGGLPVVTPPVPPPPSTTGASSPGGPTSTTGSTSSTPAGPPVDSSTPDPTDSTDPSGSTDPSTPSTGSTDSTDPTTSSSTDSTDSSSSSSDTSTTSTADTSTTPAADGGVGGDGNVDGNGDAGAAGGSGGDALDADHSADDGTAATTRVTGP